jgi:hypothetical protein
MRTAGSADLAARPAFESTVGAGGSGRGAGTGAMGSGEPACSGLPPDPQPLSAATVLVVA